MPDTMPSLPNGKESNHQKKKKKKDQGTEIDIKAVETRILSSTEHLNEILSLHAILQVSRHSFFPYVDGRMSSQMTIQE
jgi:hypothetical protein